MNLVEASKHAKGRYNQDIAPVSLRAAILRGALKGRKVGGYWEVNQSDLDKYLNSRPRWWKPGSATHTRGGQKVETKKPTKKSK
jgi:hypothetical protein